MRLSTHAAVRLIFVRVEITVSAIMASPGEQTAVQSSHQQPEAQLPTHNDEEAFLKRPRTPGLPLGHAFSFAKAKARKFDFRGSLGKSTGANEENASLPDQSTKSKL